MFNLIILMKMLAVVLAMLNGIANVINSHIPLKVFISHKKINRIIIIV